MLWQILEKWIQHKFCFSLLFSLHTMSNMRKRPSEEAPPGAQKVQIIDPRLCMHETSLPAAHTSESRPCCLPNVIRIEQQPVVLESRQATGPSGPPKTPIPTRRRRLQLAGSTSPRVTQNSPTVRALKRAAKHNTIKTADVTHFFERFQIASGERESHCKLCKYVNFWSFPEK